MGPPTWLPQRAARAPPSGRPELHPTAVNRQLGYHRAQSSHKTAQARTRGCSQQAAQPSGECATSKRRSPRERVQPASGAARTRRRIQQASSPHLKGCPKHCISNAFVIANAKTHRNTWFIVCFLVCKLNKHTETNGFIGFIGFDRPQCQVVGPNLSFRQIAHHLDLEVCQNQ